MLLELRMNKETSWKVGQTLENWLQLVEVFTSGQFDTNGTSKTKWGVCMCKSLLDPTPYTETVR